MRRIELAACEIVVISLESQGDRYKVVRQRLEALGLPHRLLPAIECRPGAIGCGLSHIKALRAWDGARPLLVLEDDIDQTSAYASAIEVPADADAVYLGASSFGTIETLKHLAAVGAVIAEPAAPGLVRIHNMLASHAIVHLTDRWRSAAVEAMLKAIVDWNMAPDQGLASIQGDFRIYAPQAPMFYQCPELQPPEIAQKQIDTTLVTIPTRGLHDLGRLHHDDQMIDIKVAADGGRLFWVAAEPSALTPAGAGNGVGLTDQHGS